MQGVDRIPDGHFTANDGYLYYWHAQRITELGYLPSLDEHRWLPQGRNVSQTLPFYSYVLAYTHKVIRLFFYQVSLYDIHLYAPAACFTFALGILALFLFRTVGFLFAFIVTLLLATLPGCVDRSAVGFSDRDAWCWLLGALVVISYLWKERIPITPPDNESVNGSISIRMKSIIINWRRYVAAAMCGVFVLLGGLS